MAKTLDEVLVTLPKARRDLIDARYRELRKEVESLAALRKAAGKAQVEIATLLRISQPSVSKIEKQTDMYLSTLRNYVEAMGGDLELVVRFPRQPPLRLSRLGDALEEKRNVPRARTHRTRNGVRRVAKRA